MKTTLVELKLNAGHCVLCSLLLDEFPGAFQSDTHNVGVTFMLRSGQSYVSSGDLQILSIQAGGGMPTQFFVYTTPGILRLT